MKKSQLSQQDSPLQCDKLPKRRSSTPVALIQHTAADVEKIKKRTAGHWAHKLFHCLIYISWWEAVRISLRFWPIKCLLWSLKAKHNERLWCKCFSRISAQSSHKTHNKSMSINPFLYKTALQRVFFNEKQKNLSVNQKKAIFLFVQNWLHICRQLLPFARTPFSFIDWPLWLSCTNTSNIWIQKTHICRS